MFMNFPIRLKRERQNKVTRYEILHGSLTKKTSEYDRYTPIVFKYNNLLMIEVE